MVHIDEPDLMPCQLCDGKPALHGGNFESYVYCESCMAQGPRVECNAIDPDETDETMGAKQEIAAGLWNQMQGWIAKGRVSDGLALPAEGAGGKRAL